MPSARARTLLVSLLYIATFVLADKAATAFAVIPGVSLWYPPPGLTLALLMVFGLRWLPLALAASLLSAWFVYPMPETWATIAMALSTTLNYAAVAALSRAWFGRPPRLDRMPAAFGFAFLLLVAALPTAVVGTWVLQAVDLSSPDEFSRSVFRWWLGDTAGVLSLLPLLLINVAPLLRAERRPAARTPRAPRFRSEVAAQAAALLGSLALIYVWPPMRESYVPYLSFVPLTWIVLRHGLPGAALAIFVVNVGSVFVLKAAGATEPILVTFLLFQFATTAMGLGLGAMVSGRQRAETERNRLLEIVEATPDFVARVTPDGRILYCNTALRALHDATEPADDTRLTDLAPAAAAAAVLRDAIPAALAQGRWTGETALLQRDGSELPVSAVIVPHRAHGDDGPELFVVARDISAQRKAEAQRLAHERKMLSAQKLESLGVLAGGVAHDFNNLLTAMLGHAGIAREELGAGATAVQHSLQQIEIAATRAAELCQQMLAYSGRGQMEVTAVNVSTLIHHTAHLLRVSVPKKSNLEFDLPPNLPAVRADPTQLRQAVMNLVLNAVEAIGAQRGTVRISAGAMRADEAWLAAGAVTPPPPPGDYVYIDVLDDGCGMPAETRARIFEPFFTTKFTGHGLGLPALLGIVRSHGGTVRVYSEPQQGSRFRIALPAITGNAASATRKVSTEPGWRGEGTILVVDDEEAVRVAVARMLENCGFTTELAGDGQEAVDRVSAGATHYRAVVLDVLMPVLDGEQALIEIRRQRPDLPVLMMSGYSGRGIEGIRDAGPTAFLAKPFKRDTLISTLRELLRATRPPGP